MTFETFFVCVNRIICWL